MGGGEEEHGQRPRPLKIPNLNMIYFISTSIIQSNDFIPCYFVDFPKINKFISLQMAMKV